MIMSTVSAITWFLCLFGVSSLPNVLFILVDDLGWNDLSFHDGCDFPTPNIDKLQESALTLNNYYVQHICSPTRSTIISGMYPIHTGLQHFVIQPSEPYALPLRFTTLPEEFKKAGYDTHMIGKWHLGFFNGNYTPNYRGFDSYFGYYLGMEDYFTHFRQDGQSGDSGFDFHNNTEPVFINNTYSTYIYGNLTLDLLQKYSSNSNSNPFFIYLPFQAVHAPLEAPENVINSFYNKTISNYQRSVKAAMVTVLDDTIGDIINAINKYKLWDDLLIIFSTDNGGPVYKNEASSNWPIRGSKATLWEGGLRGDSFVTGGYLNDQRRGQISNELMHSTDWLPTICDVIGVTPSNQSILDGFSMLDVIQKGSKSLRSEILHNIDPVNCTQEICGAIRINEWKLVVGKEVMNHGCSSGWCYTYQILNGSMYNNTTVKCGSNIPPIQNYSSCPYNGKPCLYNIAQDPCEYTDVSEENNDVVNQLYSRLLYYNSTMVTPLWLLNPMEPEKANPANFGNFWTPWRNSSHQNQGI